MTPNLHNPVKRIIPATGGWSSPAPATNEVETVDPTENAPIRKFSLMLALVVMFLRISGLHQAETFVFHVNLKLLFVFGIPAILGTVLCGGVGRTLRRSTAYYWLFFSCWVVVAVPFSYWRGGSVQVVENYWRTNVIMVFFAGGLVIGWKECQTLMRAIAVGAMGTLALARVFEKSADMERFSMDFGSVGNPNDFACHLLFCLPFLYWVVVSSKSFIMKIFCLGGIAYGLLLIIRTASRGALISIGVIVIVMLIWGSMKERFGLVLAVPLGLALVTSFVSRDTLTRIVSFSSEAAKNSNISAEAIASSDARKYLLGKSIEYTISHPIFGVGPGQFSSYEGTHNVVVGSHGEYLSTHNTFTQVSAECGIPAFLFFTAGLFTSFGTFWSIFRKARKRGDSEDIATAMYCILLAMIGFVISSSFLNFAYYFYQPLLGGMSVSVFYASKAEFAKRDRIAQDIMASGPQTPLFPASRFAQGGLATVTPGGANRPF